MRVMTRHLYPSDLFETVISTGSCVIVWASAGFIFSISFRVNERRHDLDIATIFVLRLTLTYWSIVPSKRALGFESDDISLAWLAQWLFGSDCFSLCNGRMKTSASLTLVFILTNQMKVSLSLTTHNRWCNCYRWHIWMTPWKCPTVIAFENAYLPLSLSAKIRCT